MREIAAAIKTLVLPVPGPPAINKGEPRWATAASCFASNSIGVGASGLRVSLMEGVVI